MIDSSPDVAAALGIDPKACPIGAFIGGLGLWATGLYLAVDDLHRMQAEREKKEKAAVAGPPSTPFTAPAAAVAAPAEASKPKQP